MAHRKFNARFGLALLTAAAAIASATAPARAADPLAWPPINDENRQWTRWWWMGSAVDKTDISALLRQYHDAGFGGVEICPIYGVRGAENRYIPYLSPRWLDMLGWTGAQTQRLGMEMDLTTGTGWPMGGLNSSLDDASSTFIGQRMELAGGTEIKPNLVGNAVLRGEAIPSTNGGPLQSPLNARVTVQCVMAYSGDGQKIDLTSQVKDGMLDWTAPPGTWRVYYIDRAAPAMKVKRPAPGDEGNVLDPFSVKALDDYLAVIDKAFAGYKGVKPRAQFHDSYEYVGDWTAGFFEQFKSRRGYDLRDELPAFFGEGPADTAARVATDYRQTINDLHMEYLKRWVDWNHAHGELAREQAHGAPANLLDLYGESDIPETETFGNAATVASDENFPMNKFASSAAHVTGRQLASSESFTWLGQHFQIALSDVKPVADYILLTGINHMFLHGVAYSPKDVAWPGWLFYAGVDFNPNGGLWHDMPAYTDYIARCQSILQRGGPSNDVLLYFPVYDFWQTAPETGANASPRPIDFKIGGDWARGTPFYSTALALEARGYGVDYISDAQLTGAKVVNGSIIVGGNTYHAVVLPPCKVMPPKTLAMLVDIAKAGGAVVSSGGLPSDVPGLDQLDVHRAELALSLKELGAAPPTDGQAIPPVPPAQGIALGSGYFWVGKNLSSMLQAAGVDREPMVDLGLRFIRRTYDYGYNYFVVNRGGKTIDGWVTLSVPAMSVVILDPMWPDRAGVAATRKDPSGRIQVYLQMQPGESRFLRTVGDQVANAAPWIYTEPAGQPVPVAGTWKIHFTEGGPALPADIVTRQLASWTQIGDAEAKRFAGTARYSISINVPLTPAADWLLDLGRVCESVRVKVNGGNAGVAFSSPFTIHVGRLIHPGTNTLELEVTNLAANRVRDLDIRGVKWKIFRDINFVSPGVYAPFDASAWPLRDSGLLGPVQLIPLKTVAPEDIK